MDVPRSHRCQHLSMQADGPVWRWTRPQRSTRGAPSQLPRPKAVFPHTSVTSSGQGAFRSWQNVSKHCRDGRKESHQHLAQPAANQQTCPPRESPCFLVRLCVQDAVERGRMRNPEESTRQARRAGRRPVALALLFPLRLAIARHEDAAE